MKTKEEIEQLAEEFLTFHQDGSKVYHVKIREAIKFAYNKCQEDMADKNYTEADMLHCWNTVMVAMTNKNPIFFKDYINSLNKQD